MLLILILNMDNWKIWDNDKNYGDFLKERSLGNLPEMESSKSISSIINNYLKENDTILDFGCASGHYVKSFENRLTKKFNYIGLDATKYYIDCAKSVFKDKYQFKVDDVFNSNQESSSADIVICNNLFHHLPSIEIPLKELIRISKKYIIIRTLIGNQTFRIKQAEEPEIINEEGELVNFHYYNIYSANYIKSLIKKQNLKSYELIDDNNYNSEVFKPEKNWAGKPLKDLTSIIDGKQINGYIIQPWKFIILEK